MAFSAEELERYRRHILLKEIGGAGQQKLRGASVALIGAGGLGAPAALYLAAAGVGRLRIIDPDAASLPNLQRQVVYRSEDVGRSKVERTAEALLALNPNVTVEPVAERLGDDNAQRLLAGVELVLDGCDDFGTRFAVNAAAHALGIALISGAVGRWDGQIATFKSGLTKGKPEAERLPCYRCFVPEIPPDAEPCSLVGIVGALTGVIGSMMALEAIKEITGAGESLAGRLTLFDGLRGEARTVRLNPDPECPTCGA
ncbi:MAG TPA: HesA/MoeB/ThiF family protein [Caulobacterales bacterium]|nr:HesA/MoeB/ThiF family protein [Caulobacterales bacterium]